MGFNFRHLGLLKESIKEYTRFFNYYTNNEQYLTDNQKSDFLYYRSGAYGYLADVYAKATYLDSASLTHKKNIRLTEHHQDIRYASALNNYGLFFYWTKKELDSALIYFTKAYDVANSTFAEDHLVGSIRDNIADVYVEQGKTEAANLLYEHNFDFYKNSKTELYKGIDSRRLISAGVQLINTSIALGRLDHIETILNQMYSILNDTTATRRHYPVSRLHYLQAKERVLIAQNKTHEAYELSKEVKQLSDSLTQIDIANKNAIKNTISELTFERLKTKHLIEKQQKENQIKNQRLKLWIVTISSVSILGLIVLLFIRRKQHIEIARSKQQIAELQNEKLNSEIESKQRDLSDFAIKLTQNQEWARELAEKLSQLKSTKGRERKKLFEAFEQDVQNKITFDVDTKAFFQKLDKLSDAFYSVLHAKYPDLSKTEKRISSLIRLKIESHEIATLQNITLSSLNTSRYRLRKKLKLSKEDDLDDFIQNL
jgi:DNA-binding CsgD family transcriptional regulator